MSRFVPALFLALGLAGCSNVDNVVDCKRVCDKYKSCYDDKYDTSACYDRCRASSKDSAFEQTVADCHACIDGKSCTMATFSCGTECGAVVP